MTDRLSIALAQVNPTVGDLDHNRDLILQVCRRAAEEGAGLVLFPELALTGYSPEDLVLRPSFLDAVEDQVRRLAEATRDGGPGVIVGAPWRQDGQLYNAVLVLDKGKIADVRFKVDLPNYGVFDEKRLFTAGPPPEPVTFRGVRLGLPVCEDYWKPETCRHLAGRGAEILLSPNASPFETGKAETRLNLVASRVRETGLPMALLNQVGGQDDLVFDGTSFVLNRDGAVAVQMGSWREQYVLARWTRGPDRFWSCDSGSLHTPVQTGPAAVYHALVLGLKDYVRKNGFPGVILGLSGGIDSALAAVLAVDALGADRVHCVMMPSPYTSQDSLDDAAELARVLGCRLDTIPIEPAMKTFAGALDPVVQGLFPDITQQNIQSRIRGLILMALSNTYGGMVLATSNKSEMATGYATLYGDMCGGYAVLKDVYKTMVFALARWRNTHVPVEALGPAGHVIPERVITRPPTAELRTGQTDQDTLPPYDVLDDVLECLVDHNLGIAETARRGHPADLVQTVRRMVDRAEYKRRQSAPGPKITRRAFGHERRWPITNGYRES
ncbi:MAG: NAD+ synthase [Pseudomonadota bacterium]|nr:NAD+ synthase [Pseudomonadota bacterium]